MTGTRNLRQMLSIFSTFLFTLWTIGDGEITCKKVNSCSCAYEEQIIDLSPLKGNPKWFDQYDPENVNMYSYNPCAAFTEETCENVAMCQNTGAEYYDLGTQESATFTNDPQTGQLSVEYKGTDAIGVTRTSQVMLTCVDKGEDAFNALGETSPGSGYYLFTLSSIHSCAKKRTNNNTSASAGLSLGSYISIGFLCVAVLYLCLGITIQKLARKQTGRDVIPNYNSWTSFFGLVKDGFVFVFKCGPAVAYTSMEK